MSAILLTLGFTVAAVGANIFRTPEAQRAGIFKEARGLVDLRDPAHRVGSLFYGVVNFFS